MVAPVAYATLRDVYDLGFTAGAFVRRPRPLSVSAGDFLDFATGTFWQQGHGYFADDLVRLVLVGTGGSIPTGGSSTTIYSPLPVDSWRFQLALAPNGSPVTFSDAGTTSGAATAWGLQLDPEPWLLRLCVSKSAEIDQDMTDNDPPLQVDPTTGKYHPKVTAIVARMVARHALAGLTFTNPELKTASERVFAQEKADDEQRKDWRNGQPLNPRATDQDVGAEYATRSGYERPALRWNRGWL